MNEIEITAQLHVMKSILCHFGIQTSDIITFDFIPKQENEIENRSRNAILLISFRHITVHRKWRQHSNFTYLLLYTAT